MSCRKSMTLLFSCFPHPLSDATNNGPPPSEMGAKPSGHTKTLLVRQRREEAYQRIIKTLFQRMAADMPTAIFFRKEEWLECCQTFQLFAFLEAGLIFSMVTLTSGRMEILFCLCGRRRGLIYIMIVAWTIPPPPPYFLGHLCQHPISLLLSFLWLLRLLRWKRALLVPRSVNRKMKQGWVATVYSSRHGLASKIEQNNINREKGLTSIILFIKILYVIGKSYSDHVPCMRMKREVPYNEGRYHPTYLSLTVRWLLWWLMQRWFLGCPALLPKRGPV